MGIWIQGGLKTEEEEPPVQYLPPSWGGGTDAEIIEALEKHYNDEIDLTEYWAVGDKRTVSLSAMSATGVGESHPAQTVELILLNVGGRELQTPINGHTECAFIVGQKNCLCASSSSTEIGYIHNNSPMYTAGSYSTATKRNSWIDSKRRTWCNEIYYNAIPESIRSIFKVHKVQTKYVYYTRSVSSFILGNMTTWDYFTLPSIKDLNGLDDGISTTSQLTYYETSSNRKKKYWTATTSTSYWTNTYPYSKQSVTSWGSVSCSSGSLSYTSTFTTAYGIAPQGVI